MSPPATAAAAEIPVPAAPTRRPPRSRLHVASVVGRARADRGPLLLTALVVAVVTLLAAAVPPAGRRAADAATRDAVAAAGAAADLTATVPYNSELTGAGVARQPLSAVLVAAAITTTRGDLPASLAGRSRPAASATTDELALDGARSEGTLRLAYVVGPTGPPPVLWTSGRAPSASTPDAPADVARPPGSPPWPVEVGVPEDAAAVLRVGPGDSIAAEDRNRNRVDVRVSGVYRVVDPADPAWQQLPQLVRPRVNASGSWIGMAALLSQESLPDARLAVAEDQVTRSVTWRTDPSSVSWRDADDLAASVVRLQAGSGPASGLADRPSWQSRLDVVLGDALNRVAAAWAQASVLLTALVAAGALVLVLTGELLARRRTPSLAGARLRGASLPGTAAELLVESCVVTAAAGGVGLLVAGLVAGGAAWPWAVPVAVVAVLAGPVAGVRAAARATGRRRAPADRSARLAVLRTQRLRSSAAELAVVVAAVAALTALHQRGVVPAHGHGPDLLSAAAPTLAAVSGALLLRWLLPVATRIALGRTARSQRMVPFLAAARAAAAARQSLQFIVVTLSCTLLALAATTAATQQRGHDQVAWELVGGDARLRSEPAPGVADVATRVAAQPGVRLAVAARVRDGVPTTGQHGSGTVRVVAVDAAAFDRLLRATPLGDAADLGRLGAAPAPDGRLPALLRSARPGIGTDAAVGLSWDDAEVPLTVVGTAPPIGSTGADVVVVDAGAFTAAGGDSVPDTVWAIGPRAAEALAAAAPREAVVVARTDLLAERRRAPLAAALRRLALLSAATLLALAALGVVIGAATSSPERGQTLARLRTMGLRGREARQVTTGELLVPVLAGAVGGLVLGVLIARLSLGPLALRLVTGQATDPALSVPWWAAAPAVLLSATVLAVVRFESSLRRRERLGEVLRAGGA